MAPPMDALETAPSAERNKEPILEVLARVLPASGLVLEIGSGTGQHVAHFARALPHLTFQPSEVDRARHASIAAWIEHERLANVRPPLAFDVTRLPWPLTSAEAIVCINVIHISPWEATLGLMRGAGEILPPGGVLVTYGPYRRGGAHTAPSNEAFDAWLKERDPRWGVRDIEAVAAAARESGLELEEMVPMPANNFTLVFRSVVPPAKAGAQGIVPPAKAGAQGIVPPAKAGAQGIVPPAKAGAQGAVMPHPTRMDAVQAPIIPTIGALVRATPGTISLGQGVVHYPPPREAIEAAARALAEPATSQYNSAAGIPPLLERIGAKLAAENGIDVKRGLEVMVTAGGNMAFMHAVHAITQPGDEIVINTPYYFNHEMAIRIAGCTPVCVATDENYLPRVEALRAAITDRTRAIVTVTPNNPTGAVYPEDSLRAVNALCREHGLYHVSDEAYEYFTYGEARHFSPGSLPGAEAHTISLYSLSKAYGFAGWRIGYMAYPAHLEEAMTKIQDTVLICPPISSQVAAAAALGVGRAYCEPYLRELAEVRKLVLDQLATLAPRVKVPVAEGAFYCFAKVDSPLDPMTVAERLIREHKVAVLPGMTFGIEGCYLRIAYGALKKETVAEGMGRLVRGLKECLAT